jgi:DNA polymerase-1
VNSLAEDSFDQRPLVLLDGMSLAFRAFFALSTDIKTSEGVVTNALHGFASMLHSLVRTQEPRGLCVAFDLTGGTFRDAMTEDYKGGRAETPLEIEHQFDLIRSLCEVLHIPVLGVPNFEADDVLATLATWGRDAKMPVVVVSGDRDTFQLVEDPFVKVLYNRRGVSDYSLYDEKGIFERCGIEPKRYPLLAALRGDTSDNLPGVPGVGEKTAAKLFSQYRDFDDLYQHLDQLTPKLRENLATFEERARNNAKVMLLVRDVPLDFTLEDITVGGWKREEVSAFFDRFEMNAMRTRFEKLMRDGLFGPASASSMPAKTTSKKESTATRKRQRVASLTDVLKPAGAYVLSHARGRVAVLDPTNGVVAVASESEFFALASDCSLSGHDLKELYRRASDVDVTLREPTDDTSIMAFLLDATSGQYELADVVQRFLAETIAPHAPSLFDETSDDDTLLRDVEVIARLRDVLRSEITRWELDFVYEQVELPLVAVLGRMESRGVSVDVAMLRTINDEFAKEATSLDAKIQKVAGHEFKVNSPQQLQTVLFDELGLTAVKKIKSGFSTDAASLEAIQDEHKIVALILRYREVEKLRSTYGKHASSTPWAPTARSTPNSARRSRARDDSRRRTRTCTTSRCAPQRDGACATRSCQVLGGCSAWRTTTRSNCASSRTSVRTRVCSRAFASNEDVHRTIAAIGLWRRAANEVTSRTTRTGQGRLLRPRLRHGGLRPQPAPRRAGLLGQGDHGQILLGFPVVARLHGRNHQGHPQQGLFAHRVRAHPSVPRPRHRRWSPASGRRTPGHERWYPGTRG